MWNVNYVRAAQDCELEFFSSFSDQLYFLKLNWDCVVKLCWNLSKKGLFEVTSFYNVLTPHENNLISWRCVWKRRAPLRVTFFTWSAALGKILAMANLRKRKIVFLD